MSKLVGNTFVIEGEPSAACELCGKLAELRPYGPGGKNVCFECGMKDEALAVRQLERRMDGRPPESESSSLDA